MVMPACYVQVQTNDASGLGGNVEKNTWAFVLNLSRSDVRPKPFYF